MQDLKFRLIEYKYSNNRSKNPNTCFLIPDNWNDFGYRTSFHLSYVNGSSEILEIGMVKIMSSDMGRRKKEVKVPSEFSSLPEEFCSLGVSQSYYEEISNLPDKVKNFILDGLKDGIKGDRYKKFEDNPAMQTSLLRDNGPSYLNKYKNILEGKAILTEYSFSFNIDEIGSFDIRVLPNSIPPTNIHAIIGRNGIGKTRLLASISKILLPVSEISAHNESQAENDSYYFKGSYKNNDFCDENFANTVVVAFSVFDKFKPIKNPQGQYKYQYIGLKSYKSGKIYFKDVDALKDDFTDSISAISVGLRKKRFCDTIKFIESDPYFEELNLSNQINNAELDAEYWNEIFDRLSSGHKVILYTLVKLVQFVEEKTLVIIDEPETHLHPPLLASFMRALSHLLINRNGVALISTHSPVVLQEIPSSCVNIMDNIASIYVMHKPKIETFGENVGTLTREVFCHEMRKSGYYKMIIDAVKESDTYKTAIKKFDGKLGDEGKSIMSLEFYNKKEIQKNA